MTAAEFLRGYPEKLREIAQDMRELVRSTFPSSVEPLTFVPVAPRSHPN